MTPSEFRHVTWNQTGHLAVVRFRYETTLEYDAYAAVAQELDAVAEGEGVEAILINLDAVELVTSRFLGVLISLSKRMRSKGRAMAVCRLRPEPLNVFRISRVDALIPIYGSEEEGRAALASPAKS